MTKYCRSVDRDGSNLVIRRLDRPACASDFLRSIYDGISRGFNEFNIIWDRGQGIYPNACTPISGIIQYYKKQGIHFSFDINDSEYLSTCYFVEPLYLSAENILALDNPFDRIFRYDNDAQVAAYTQKCVNCISQQTVCEQGIFESLIWCINEVMDNVLLHSQTSSGFVMAQYHAASKHIAICVSDTGIGVYNSLKNSIHHPRKAIDALSLAVQEGVGDGQGQGNGLFGLYQIIQSNGGSLTITSGPASLMLRNDASLMKYDRLPYLNKSDQGTTVDFQLDLGRKVDIHSAFSSIGGFDGFDIRIDDMLQNDDSLLYDIFDNCKGTATRESGRLLRNDVINIIKRSGSKMRLDFSKVETVSSSFIDEFIAKMIIDLGIISFNQIITIIGMNSTVKFLCERSTYMRIFEEWKVKGLDT